MDNQNVSSKKSCEQLDLEGEHEVQDTLQVEVKTGGDNPVALQSREQLDLEGEPKIQDTLQVEVQTGEDIPVALESRIEKLPWGEAPILGMVFQSVDQAYAFYNAYARCVGFSIRINNTMFSRKKHRTILKRMLCCTKEGFRVEHPRGVAKNPRPPTRTGCKACIVIRLQSDGKYAVVQFLAEHNHEMGKQPEVHMVRSQRKIKNSQPQHKIVNSQTGVIDSMHTAGIRSTDIYMHAEAGGSQNLNFMRMDCDNYTQRKHGEILKTVDVQVLLNHFMHMQTENPSFFYSIRMDKDNQLGSCFWCDARSRMDYSFFGDAVCFDTTYKTNEYNKPYAPFVGVNHHEQSVLFGCALLFDETTESFVWLFETFLKAMKGKEPKAIFTDLAPTISNAIRQVFPNSYHRFCLWHIYQNANKHLSHVFEKFTSFATDFKNCIYNNDTEEGFQSDWDTLFVKYNLVENEWLERIYQVREKWALVYGREHFSAGITTIQRSESVNSYFKKYLKNNMSLGEFLAKYEDAVSDRRDKEIFEDYVSRRTTPTLKSRWSVEQEAAKRYTRTVFKLFQEQIQECLNLFQEQEGEDGTMFTYKVTSYGGKGGRKVTFDSSDNTVKCSCKMFEFTGILCAHALKILHSKQLPDIPSQYYLHRWTQNATAGVVVDESRKLVQVDRHPSLTSRYSELANIALALAVKGASTVNSCTLAKLELMQVLRKIDFSLQLDQDESRDAGFRIENDVNVDVAGVAGQAGMAKTLQDPPRKRPRKRRIGTKGQSDLESVVGTETPNEPPLTSGIPKLPFYPLRPSNMPQYTQATQYGFPRASGIDGIFSHPVGPSTMPLIPSVYPYSYTQGPVNQATSNYATDSTNQARTS